MKTLKESLHNELICGKQLYEKLKIKKTNRKPTSTISIPVVVYNDNIIYKNEEWREITLPNNEYVIYKDMYRYDQPHLAYIDDFLFNMMTFQNDFEDFDMDNDILFSSDDEQEIAEWYIKDYLKLKLPKKGSDSEDWIDSQHTTKKIYDNLSFIHDVYLGYDHIDNSMNLDKTNMEKLAHSFNDWMAWDIE